MLNSLVKFLLKNQIIFAITLLAFLWFIITIREIIVALFIAYILAVSIAPFVSFMQKYKIPKTIAAIICYLIFFALIVLLIIPLVPFLVSQVQTFFSNLPKILDKSINLFGYSFNLSQVKTLINPQVNNNLGQSVFALTSTVFGGIFAIITIIVVSFYLVLDHQKIKNNIASSFSKASQRRVISILTKIDEKLGAWLRGQILLSLSIGLLTWIALILLRIEYALPLALLAGILEIIPTIGPIISAIPAVLIALTISPNMALIVILVYIFIHQVENNVLVPRIMHEAIGLNPILVIITVVVGTKLMGVIGALLSIPFISILIIVFNEMRTTNNKNS